VIGLLFFIPAIAVYLGLLWFCYWLIVEDEPRTLGIIGFFVVAPLGIALLWGLAEELWTDHPQFVLDQRDWACVATHKETTTTYVMTGKVAVPVTSTRRVCDQYARKP
jgi:hypothetical protein